MFKNRNEKIILVLVIWGLVALPLMLIVPPILISKIIRSSDFFEGDPCHELGSREDIERGMEEQKELVAEIKAVRPDVIDLVIDTQRCGGNQAEIFIYHGGAADKEQILPLLKGPLFDFPYRFVNI